MPVLLRYTVDGLTTEELMDLADLVNGQGRVSVRDIKELFKIEAVKLNGIVAATDTHGITYKMYYDEEVIAVAGRPVVAAKSAPAAERPGSTHDEEGCSSSSRRPAGEDSSPIVLAEAQGSVSSSGGVSDWDRLLLLLWAGVQTPACVEKKLEKEGEESSKWSKRYKAE